jgi:hypothetical protein
MKSNSFLKGSKKKTGSKTSVYCKESEYFNQKKHLPSNSFLFKRKQIRCQSALIPLEPLIFLLYTAIISVPINVSFDFMPQGRSEMTSSLKEKHGKN